MILLLLLGFILAVLTRS